MRDRPSYARWMPCAETHCESTAEGTKKRASPGDECPYWHPLLTLLRNQPKGQFSAEERWRRWMLLSSFSGVSFRASRPDYGQHLFSPPVISVGTLLCSVPCYWAAGGLSSEQGGHSTFKGVSRNLCCLLLYRYHPLLCRSNASIDAAGMHQLCGRGVCSAPTLQ